MALQGSHTPTNDDHSLSLKVLQKDKKYTLSPPEQTDMKRKRGHLKRERRKILNKKEKKELFPFLLLVKTRTHHRKFHFIFFNSPSAIPATSVKPPNQSFLNLHKSSTNASIPSPHLTSKPSKLLSLR